MANMMKLLGKQNKDIPSSLTRAEPTPVMNDAP
jgi:hypothetical protein